jgi:hypothetical protein
LRFALIAFHCAAKDFVTAFRTRVAGLFVLDPFLGAEFPTVWDRSKNNLLPDGHGEIVNVMTGEFHALVAAGVSFLFCAVPNLTVAAMGELLIR